jgi:hypothetical protein
MGPEEISSKQQIGIVETLDNDRANWPLWQSKICFIFKSKGLLTYIEGTMIKLIINPNLVTLTQSSDEQIEKIKKYEEKLKYFHSQEG